MTASDRTDEQLVDAARRGDAAAMDQLLRRHYDRVHAVCRRIAGSTRDADDAAQEAMIKIVRNLDRFDGRSSFGTWAYRIATNTSLDELRKRQRRPQLSVVRDDEDGATQEPADDMSHRLVDAVADRRSFDREQPERLVVGARPRPVSLVEVVFVPGRRRIEPCVVSEPLDQVMDLGEALRPRS